MDLPSDEKVSRPFLSETDTPPRPGAPLGGAAALHVVAGLALIGSGFTSTPTAPVVPPPTAMSVTLVEPPRPEPAATAPQEAPAAASPEPPEPTELAVTVAPSTAAAAPLAMPDYLRLEDPTASVGAPTDAVRAALAQSMRCRSVTGDEQADCPASSDGYALAEAAGIGPRVFLDSEGLAPYEEFNVAAVGAIAAVFTAEGSCGPDDIRTFRLVFRPRGAALSAADRQAGELKKTWC